ncbi:MAG: GLUG motif-containing protein, partial [Candidatus Gastranaerophilaceae bacterium]
IQNCSADVNITSQGSNVGGLIGYVQSVNTISNCTTSGVITAYSVGGGLIGKMDTGNVNNCISNADVKSTLCNVYNPSNNSYNNDACTGGFIGILNGGTISNCEATGDVTAEGLVVGGFIGYLMSGTIKESTARGDVTGNINSNIIKIKNEYMANTAGFVSAVCGVIENCDAYGNVSFGEIEGATIIPPTSFASSNMSGVSGKGEINNCYAATTSDDTLFINNKHNLASEPTISDTPNNSPVSVTPPTIQVNETINDTVDAGKVFDEIKKYGYILEGSNNDPVGNNGDNSTWFTNMVNAGLLFIFKNDTQGNEYQVNVATDTNLQEVSSDLELKKAEAKYEADMRKINAKDKKFDTDIAALETERNAIKTEMDTLKTIAKDNVDRTFKLFS